MNASYIDKIRAHAITEWANGKCGEITYFEREIGREIERKYRFVEINPQTMQYVHGIVEQETKSPIIAEGIVAYWLSSKTGVAITDIFDNYSQQCLQAYCKSRQGRIDSWNKDLEKQFYSGYHLNEEKKKILNSETLFPFVGENDAEQLKELMKAYKGYIMKKSREMRFWRPLQSIWAFIKGFIGVSVGV